MYHNGNTEHGSAHEINAIAKTVVGQVVSGLRDNPCGMIVLEAVDPSMVKRFIHGKEGFHSPECGFTIALLMA